MGLFLLLQQLLPFHPLFTGVDPPVSSFKAGFQLNQTLSVASSADGPVIFNSRENKDMFL